MKREGDREGYVDMFTSWTGTRRMSYGFKTLFFCETKNIDPQQTHNKWPCEYVIGHSPYFYCMYMSPRMEHQKTTRKIPRDGYSSILIDRKF